jgi:hypothetical protein
MSSAERQRRFLDRLRRAGPAKPDERDREIATLKARIADLERL